MGNSSCHHQNLEIFTSFEHLLLYATPSEKLAEINCGGKTMRSIKMCTRVYFDENIAIGREPLTAGKPSDQLTGKKELFGHRKEHARPYNNPVVGIRGILTKVLAWRAIY